MDVNDFHDLLLLLQAAKKIIITSDRILTGVVLKISDVANAEGMVFI